MSSLITFEAISNFTNDLGEVFSDKHRPLKLYIHLINKTTLQHKEPINKHIDAFRKFCIENRDAIAEKNVKKFVEEKISYSNRVFIDMKQILNMADRETSIVIWNHLLTISALVDPTGKARQILKDQTKKNDSNKGEADFLTDIISKVEGQVDPNANPMEAVTSIMQSGVFNDLVQNMGDGLQDGSLDLQKLMGTVSTMVTKLSDEAGDKEGGDQAMNMINTMMGSMNAGAEAPDNNGEVPMPNIAGMLGPMMGAMMNGNNEGGMPDLAGMMNNNTGGSGNAIEDKINAQVAAARAKGDLPEIKEE